MVWISSESAGVTVSPISGYATSPLATIETRVASTVSNWSPTSRLNAEWHSADAQVGARTVSVMYDSVRGRSSVVPHAPANSAPTSTSRLMARPYSTGGARTTSHARVCIAVTGSRSLADHPGARRALVHVRPPQGVQRDPDHVGHDHRTADLEAERQPALDIDDRQHRQHHVQDRRGKSDGGGDPDPQRRALAGPRQSDQRHREQHQVG